MRLKPPHYINVRYNGVRVPDGGSIDVLPQDVDALLAEGWTSAEPAPEPPSDGEEGEE